MNDGDAPQLVFANSSSKKQKRKSTPIYFLHSIVSCQMFGTIQRCAGPVCFHRRRHTEIGKIDESHEM